MESGEYFLVEGLKPFALAVRIFSFTLIAREANVAAMSLKKVCGIC